jgi:hypothetical protein
LCGATAPHNQAFDLCDPHRSTKTLGYTNVLTHKPNDHMIKQKIPTVIILQNYNNSFCFMGVKLGLNLVSHTEGGIQEEDV